MNGGIVDSRLERAIHVMYPAALAALMLRLDEAKSHSPEATVGIAFEEDGPVMELRAADLFPVCRLEMDRRQGKSRDRVGRGT